jgi:hypothetical protein
MAAEYVCWEIAAQSTGVVAVNSSLQYDTLLKEAKGTSLLTHLSMGAAVESCWFAVQQFVEAPWWWWFSFFTFFNKKHDLVFGSVKKEFRVSDFRVLIRSCEMISPTDVFRDINLLLLHHLFFTARCVRLKLFDTHCSFDRQPKSIVQRFRACNNQPWI